MATLSHYSYLMRQEYGTTGFAKLIDVDTIPDIGGEPETIDITTLSDMRRRNMNGIQGGDSHTFTGFYTWEIYQALYAIMEADLEKADSELDTYQIWIGTNGAKGKFEWKGRLAVYITGYGVNEAVKLSITISDEGEDAIHPVTDGPTPPGPTPEPVHVTGVTLDQSTLALDTVTTTTGTLVATVAPSNADDRSVSWSSSDTAVATVANGVVTAVGAGTATITVTTTDGGYTATCEVTVS